MSRPTNLTFVKNFDVSIPVHASRGETDALRSSEHWPRGLVRIQRCHQRTHVASKSRNLLVSRARAGGVCVGGWKGKDKHGRVQKHTE